MARTMHVHIVSAEKEIFSGEAEMFTARGSLGDLGILPGHRQLLTGLAPGSVHIKSDQKEEVLYVSGGFMEVQPDGVIVLADTVLRERDLNEGAAQESRQNAEKVLAGKPGTYDREKAKKQLAESIAQLRLIEYIKGKA